MEEGTAKSKFGGVPVEETPAAPARGMEKLGGNPPSGGISTKLPPGLQDDDQNGPIPTSEMAIPQNNFVTHGLSKLSGAIPAMSNSPARGIADAIEGAGEIASPFAVPAAVAAPVAAAGSIAGGYLGGAAGSGIARHFGASPDVQRLAGDIGAIPGGIAGGKATAALGKMAVPVTRSALQLPTNDSAREVLNQTTGVRPATIRDQIRPVIADQKAIRTAAETAPTATDPSLRPALQTLEAEANRVGAGNGEYPYVDRMKSALTDPGPRFKGAVQYPQGSNTPINIQNATLPSGAVNPFQSPIVTRGKTPTPQIAESQSPGDFRKIRSIFGEQNTKFDPGRPLPRPELQAGNDAYMAMTNEYHRAVPGSAAPDQVISNLLPALKKTRVLANAPGPVDRLINRATRPTGAMAVPLVAYGAGGPIAAGAASAAQEMLTDPASRMAIARTLRGAGKTLPAASGAILGGRSRDQ